MPPAPSDSALESALNAVVADCLAVRAGEEVLVIADPPSRELGDALRDVAAGAGPWP
jgi:hypothetical protein